MCCFVIQCGWSLLLSACATSSHPQRWLAVCSQIHGCIWVSVFREGVGYPDQLAEHQWKCNARLPVSSLAICVQHSAVGTGPCTGHSSSGLCAAAASKPAWLGLAGLPEPERGRRREPALFNEALQREGAALPKIIQQSARPVTPRAALAWTHKWTCMCTYCTYRDSVWQSFSCLTQKLRLCL